MPKNLSKYLPVALLFLLLCLYCLFLFRPILLTSSDLGRHIANGREIISGNTSVLYTNAYSYTHPDQPFINHHWLTGVIFYGLEQLGGFKTLHLVNTTVLLAMYSIFFFTLHVVTDKKHPWIVFLTGILAVLFLGSRTEIRPESFGYLFISILLLFLFSLEKKKDIILSWKTISAILLLQLVWVNLHISFIFGIFLSGLFMFCTIFLPKIFSHFSNSTLSTLNSCPFLQTKLSSKTRKQFTILLVGQILVSLINPNHIKGLFVPFSIFSNYGYSVVENQTMWFLKSFAVGPIIPLYFFTAIALLIFCIIFWKKTSAFSLILAITGIVLGYTALRNTPLFVLFSFPFLVQVFAHMQELAQKKFTFETPKFYFPTLSLGFFFIIFTIVISGNYRPFISYKNISLGLAPNQLAAAKFFKQNNLSGPIFNNYDLGSYLIYALPDEKVFVDNRPEAYTVDFFDQDYKPMQQNLSTWQEQVEKHNIQTIFFGHRDITPWAQSFMKYMVSNPDWEVIYQDEFIVIFAHRL